MRIRLKPTALRSFCTTKGISRDELSRRMGVATSTAYRVERGDVEPSPKFIAALMKTTDMAFEDLFEIVGSEAVPA